MRETMRESRKKRSKEIEDEKKQEKERLINIKDAIN